MELMGDGYQAALQKPVAIAIAIAFCFKTRANAEDFG
jgi:hypothetical protein